MLALPKEQSTGRPMSKSSVPVLLRPAADVRWNPRNIKPELFPHRRNLGKTKGANVNHESHTVQER
jgi:hypothetical protein